MLIRGIDNRPEVTAIGPYTAGIAEALARRGDRVTVLTGLPHYPAWRIAAGTSRRLFTSTEVAGVRVLRASHYVPSRQSALRRGAYEGTFLPRDRCRPTRPSSWGPTGCRRSWSASPLQAVTDAAILASITDGTLLVIDVGRTRRVAAGCGREALAKSGARVLGAALNRLSHRAAQRLRLVRLIWGVRGRGRREAGPAGRVRLRSAQAWLIAAGG